MASIKVQPSGQACGATITGVDLRQPLSDFTIGEIRKAWLEHHVVAFPDQQLSDDDLERFALYFGDYGDDGFFGPIEGREHIAAILREANDSGPLFAEGWHSDWSYQEQPPAATVLYAIDIPPIGGDTLFANQHMAYEAMPQALRQKFEGRQAIHSAAYGYAPDTGLYGTKARQGSMNIQPSAVAHERRAHPLVRPHPETGRAGLFSTMYGYIVSFDDLTDEEAMPLLKELCAWQTRDEFIYRHRWQNQMLVMWDNRSVLHRATGGYEGYRRELHRITVG